MYFVKLQNMCFAKNCDGAFVGHLTLAVPIESEMDSALQGRDLGNAGQPPPLVPQAA